MSATVLFPSPQSRLNKTNKSQNEFANTDGDTRATTRRMSDTPASAQDHFLDEDEGDDIKGVKEEPQSVLGTVHELVAKALGGGSRGKTHLESGNYLRPSKFVELTSY
ncbi:hypothetical protein N7478_010794 [Penicillium angulare]|uniref:uncharacterized protein n=1 Tax=Penicillium angulare TaxID=116970 RepID=UPI0025419A42|nr:uncharacterized protein N7478_010794 [Penicillium angulare]KAJ5263189.1 hypothetical protein N7478_010794 [Penicillium angulare]